jgi:hypothetical protein
MMCASAGADGGSGDGGDRAHIRPRVRRALAGTGQPHLPGDGHAPAPPGAYAQLRSQERHPGEHTSHVFFVEVNIVPQQSYVVVGLLERSLAVLMSWLADIKSEAGHVARIELE